MARKKQNTFTTLANCIGMIGRNNQCAYNKNLYQQALKESTENKTPVSSEAVYTLIKPYVFPTVEGNMTYHTIWGTHEVKQEAETILSVLNAFRIQSTLVKINQGPRITQYVIEPKLGTAVDSILKREKEFQASLHCNVSMRFDNGYVLLEVPSGNETVYLGDMLIEEEYKNATGFPLAIGMSVEGKKEYIDITKACHILISGMTGSGKSIVLHDLIISLLMKKNPLKMHLYIIDPKANEFSYYKQLAACTVISNMQYATDLLKSLCDEMERRYSALASAGCRDIESYNMKFEDTPMRRDIVFIDELSDLMKMCGKELETYIVRIAQKARACGIHLVIATQYPVASVVTGLIKANMPTKICLRVGTVTNSMVALDMPGGEKLMGQGDMLYLPNGSLKPVRLQAGFVSEVAINNVVCALMKNQ